MRLGHLFTFSLRWVCGFWMGKERYQLRFSETQALLRVLFCSTSAATGSKSLVLGIGVVPLFVHTSLSSLPGLATVCGEVVMNVRPQLPVKG